MFQNNFNQQVRLPVPFNGVDQSTLSNNLPQGNDRLPNVQLSPWMNANQQIGLLALGTLRQHAQNSIQKSGTHCAAYNLLAQNGFTGSQVYAEYGQMVIDFVEFLCVIKRYQPQEAVKMAAQRVYEALLAVVFGTYAAELQNEQVTPSGYWAGLQTAAQIFQSVTNDIRQYKSGAYNQQQTFQQPTGFPGGGQLPPIGHHQPNTGGYHVPPVNNGISQFQTSGYKPNGGNGGGYHIPQDGGTDGVASSFYDEPAPTKPLMPVEEISSDNGYYAQSTHQEAPKMQTFNQVAPNQFVEPEETNLPVPMNVDQVVVDPTYYAPQGVKLDLKRPYDTVYAPGGIIVRPAHQVEWDVTFGDDMPWLQLVDPSRFCVFLVKFPDGVVKEKFVEWNPSMEYLRHELDADMIRKAYRPNGEVVANDVPMSTIGGDAAPEADVAMLVKDGHLKRSMVPPVILERTFTGTTDLDIEAQVSEELQNLLEVNFTKEIPQPAAEYRSSYLHPLNISDEAYDQLTMLAKQEVLGQVALGLRELVAQGILPLRQYNFLNARYTAAVNEVLRDSLALTIDISDFCEDYVQLEEYLQAKRGEQMVAVLRSAGIAINNKAMCLMDLVDDESSNYWVADNYLNFQLGWSLSDLAATNIRKGKAVLISASAHPTVLEVLKGMIGRANKSEEFIVGTMRLITSDGHYLEVIRGRLVAKAVLLKLVS
jgi:hypothetical protein